MSDLDSILATMLAEVKQGKRKKKKVGKTSSPLSQPKTSYPKCWKEESLVLVATETRCLSCGNTGMSWNNELYLQRCSTKTKNVITEIERIGNLEYSPAYGALPKRVEVRSIESPTCPLCFGIGDNQGNKLAAEIRPLQLQLNFPTIN